MLLKCSLYRCRNLLCGSVTMSRVSIATSPRFDDGMGFQCHLEQPKVQTFQEHSNHLPVGYVVLDEILLSNYEAGKLIVKLIISSSTASYGDSRKEAQAE